MALGLDDQAVDELDERVVGLLDGAQLGVGVVAGFLLERFEQLVGAGGDKIATDGQRRLGVVEAEAGIGLVDALRPERGAGERGHHLGLQHKIQLFEHVAPRRVFGGHHHGAVAPQQRHDAVLARQRDRHPAQGLGIDRKLGQINHRVTHLARQRDAQIVACQMAALHQQLAQRHAALGFLALHRLLQLLWGDEPERGQGLAYSHHGHARLLFQRLQQFFGLDHLLEHQVVAQFAVAQLLLGARRLLHLLGGDYVLLDQHLADAFPDLHAAQHVGRQKNPLHPVLCIERHKQEHAHGRLEVSNRQPRLHRTIAELEAVGQARAVAQQIVGAAGMASNLWAGVALGVRQWCQRLCQADAPKHIEAQRHDGARGGHLDVSQTGRQIQPHQPARTHLAVAALDQAV